MEKMANELVEILKCSCSVFLFLVDDPLKLVLSPPFIGISKCWPKGISNCGFDNNKSRY